MFEYLLEIENISGWVVVFRTTDKRRVERMRLRLYAEGYISICFLSKGWHICSF